MLNLLIGIPCCFFGGFIISGAGGTEDIVAGLITLILGGILIISGAVSVSRNLPE